MISIMHTYTCVKLTPTIVGSRTQWSAGVRVGHVWVQDRFWYAGWVLGNAREEAAEEMLKLLISFHPHKEWELGARFLVERPWRVINQPESESGPRSRTRHFNYSPNMKQTNTRV